MKYPKLRELESSRQMVDTFRGYNHNLRISDGEFFDMKNMTSDYYPVLSPRKQRGKSDKNTEYAVTGLIAKDSLCYTAGENVYMDHFKTELEVTKGPKQLISMGAYVVIMPDRKYFNTEKVDDFGSIDERYEGKNASITYSLCDIDGDSYSNVSSEKPTGTDIPDQSYWLDTSTTPNTLKQYSASSAMWVTIATTYVKIKIDGSNLGEKFNKFDGVKISGVSVPSLKDLNSNMIVWGVGEDYIVVVGIIDGEIHQLTNRDNPIVIERKMPDVDFLVESGNRLWGCKYGLVNGEVVNEIYASKLGDFKNWNCFMGLSTDSYAASCGTDGQFTGAITHLGYPLFFKENCVHKVFGNYPANYQIQTTDCRGVQKGSSKSLAIVNEVLYYKSRNGICAYDGSLPTEVSYALGNEAYSEAVGGAHGNKYYVSMKDANEKWNVFVYDTSKGLWHREDDIQVDQFCSCRGELYAINNGDIITMLGSETKDTALVKWMAQTGEIGLYTPDMKYIARLTIRMSMEVGAEVSIYAQYDFSDDWEHLCSLTSASIRSFSIPIRPKRCDNMKLRFEGEGDVKIYSITKTIEQGSELS